MYKRYQQLADTLDHVTFVGRLATYRYYNMDQVVAQALAAFEKIRAREASTLAKGVTGAAALATAG
jgi:UDP-galactopyranose mutase